MWSRAHLSERGPRSHHPPENGNAERRDALATVVMLLKARYGVPSQVRPGEKSRLARVVFAFVVWR
jgi:hypothetical protein